MKPFRNPAFAFAVVFTFAFMAGAAPDPAQLSAPVTKLLEQGHYTRHRLDAEISKRFLNNYLEALDPSHLFFTQGDVDGFTAKYTAATTNVAVPLGDVNAASDIWDVYAKRADGRMAKVMELLKQKFDFASDRTVELDRQKAPWPKDEAEADQLWHDRIEGELLREKLAAHPAGSTAEPAQEILTRRYNEMLKDIRGRTRGDVMDIYLNALAETYDPHSNYFSRSQLDDFEIQMQLSLVGIGAEINSKDGYAYIMNLVTGGPAEACGRLNVGDRFVAVAQGDAEFVDVTGVNPEKVVGLIRGKKGTTVRLKMMPAHSSDIKLVAIVRDTVKLKDQAASAEVIERDDPSGLPRRLGWIKLPGFYSDSEHPGSKDSSSCTRDVLALVNRLKKEAISGLVIDLRNNGGGSVDEVVNLAGLFTKKGPVVQTRDSNGNRRILRSKYPAVAYDGPLVILTNRLSASASEIFAAAMQDYGRAVVVGDTHTFGKGSVQMVLPIARYSRLPGVSGNEAGALKLTIEKFYRIAGGSTQLRGVSADITLPSIYDRDEFGESALKGPMPYDVIDAAPFEKVADRPLFIAELRQHSVARVAADTELLHVQEDLDLIKQKLAVNKVSLNESTRLTEIAQEKARVEKRAAERMNTKPPVEKVYEITLDDVDKPDLQPVENEGGKNATASVDADPVAVFEGNSGDDDAAAAAAARHKRPAVDPQKDEALNILYDLVTLSPGAQTIGVPGSPVTLASADVSDQPDAGAAPSSKRSSVPVSAPSAKPSPVR